MIMGAWGTAIFSDDLAGDIRGEYNALLSIGKGDEEAERLIFDYYADVLRGGDEEESVFWFALALAEWNKGRLSEYVKGKALAILDNGGDLERWNVPGKEKAYEKRKKVIADLKDKLNSPLPDRKKMRVSVKHCPWREGSLLAYHIVHNEERVKDDPYFGKYVLLRVIQIIKYPVSRIVPEERYDEGMLVGMYKWVGDEIPDPSIAEQLEFVPIADYTIKPKGDIQNMWGNLSEGAQEQLRVNLLGRRVEICQHLDWTPARGWKKADITFLERDASYENDLPEFFKINRMQYALTNLHAFDLRLTVRLKELFGE